MHRLILTLTLASFALYSCATYTTRILEPWLGASKEELIVKWGYPQSASDVVKFENDILIYTYRSFTSGYGAYHPTQCVISFTMKKEIITSYKVIGADCPRIER